MPQPRVSMNIHIDRFRAACRARGLKLTHQRQVIFEEVVKSEGHPDAETIFQAVARRVSSVSLDTIYRNLHLFEELGLLQTRELGSGRLRFDANTRPHHHFICTRCGRVEDFESPHPALEDLPENVSHFGAVDSIYLEVRGVCRACTNK